MARWSKTSNGDKELYWENTAVYVMLREACVCKRDTSKCARIRLWPVRRDDSSCVLIGAAGVWRSDWRRRTVGAPIGQSACRLLACAREAIDSTRARDSGGLQAATPGSPFVATMAATPAVVPAVADPSV